METVTLKKTKRIFLVINILLLIGLITIVSTLLYLLINLEHSDKIILKCLPIIALGMVLVLSYWIGYHYLRKKEH